MAEECPAQRLQLEFGVLVPAPAKGNAGVHSTYFGRHIWVHSPRKEEDISFRSDSKRAALLASLERSQTSHPLTSSSG